MPVNQVSSPKVPNYQISKEDLNDENFNNLVKELASGSSLQEKLVMLSLNNEKLQASAENRNQELRDKSFESYKKSLKKKEKSLSQSKWSQILSIGAQVLGSIGGALMGMNSSFAKWIGGISQVLGGASQAGAAYLGGEAETSSMDSEKLDLQSRELMDLASNENRWAGQLEKSSDRALNNLESINRTQHESNMAAIG